MNVPNGLAALLLPLLDLTVKIAVLVALAALASLALRRAASATRHLIWLCALLASLALPVIGVLVPSQIGARWLIPMTVAPMPEAAPAKITETTTTAAPPVKPMVEKTAQTAPTADAPTVAAVEAPKPAPLTLALIGLYAIGAAIVLLQVVVGGLAVRRLARRAVRLSPESVSAQALTVARAAIGDVRSREIRLLRLPEAVPMTWGWLKPTILLPNDAESWDAERLRVVLMHEVAHIVRRDWPIQMLVHGICAAYWFHPLVWWASAQLRAESESACDDRVLLAGVAGDTYAGHLLAIAELARRRNADGGVRFVAPMARPGGLQVRLCGVMNERIRRSVRAPRRQAVLSGLGVAAITTLLGLIHTSTHAAKANPPAAKGLLLHDNQVNAAFDAVPTLKAWTAPVGKEGEIELVAIGEHAQKQQGHPGKNASIVHHVVIDKVAKSNSPNFWQPNGSVLKQPLSDPLSGRFGGFELSADERSVNIYFRVKPVSAKESEDTASLGLAKSGTDSDDFALSVVNFQPALPSGDTLGIMMALPSRDKKYADIALQVAAGPWQPIAHIAPSSWTGDPVEFGTSAAKKVAKKMAMAGAVVSVMRPEVQKGKVTFTVLDTLADRNYRVYAVDRQGNSLESEDSAAGIMDRYRNTSFSVRLDKGKTVKDIAYIAFETRTQHTVKFSHVALYPQKVGDPR